MHSIIQKIVLILSSFSHAKFAGKMLGLFDFCRETVCKNPKTFAYQIHRRMDINSIIPLQTEEIMNVQNSGYKITNKIKVRIVYPSGCSWNNIHTLYEEFSKDDRFQTYVLVENNSRFTKVLESAECQYILIDQYDLKGDNPDIFIATFYSSADKTLSFDGCRNYMKRVYSAFPNAVMNEENTDIHWEYVHRAYQYVDPDFYLVDPLVYNGLKGYVDDSKLVKMGNPQFDEIFREVGRNHPIPQTWEKLNGKKIFLWATDHGINESYAKNGFTIDLYLGPMLKYFSQHPDQGLIFRPHPQFMREMRRDGHFWSQEDIQRLEEYIAATNNVVWDNTPDFCCAHDTCSALMVDANCSITCTFLTTGKPICRLLRDDINEWLISPELHDCYYYAKGFQQCEEFMNMIVRGDDYKEEQRREARDKSIVHFDGNNGKRMKEFIVDDFLFNDNA